VDDHAIFAMILHKFGNSTEGHDLLRRNSLTQKLTITQQLNNGIRFLDLRMMYEHDKKEWYSLHFLQSKQSFKSYLKSIRDWIDAHPSEILVILLTRHGDVALSGNAAFPGVSANIKQKFWHEFLDLFGHVLIDTTTSPFNTTSIDDLVARNHRIIPYIGDVDAFTSHSSRSRALDAALVDNCWIEAGVADQPATQKERIDVLCSPRRKAAKDRSGFFLLSISTSANIKRVSYVAEIELLQAKRGDNSKGVDALTNLCAKSYNIPGMESWCPNSLLDGSQLTSYYNQFLFEKVLEAATNTSLSSCGFPNGFYGDALDIDGTFRTGTQALFGGPLPKGAKNEHSLERYAYVYSVIFYNILIGCEHNIVDGVCKEEFEKIQNKRRLFPFKLWEEISVGRRTDWP